jgi:hypothetical protein
MAGPLSHYRRVWVVDFEFMAQPAGPVVLGGP